MLIDLVLQREGRSETVFSEPFTVGPHILVAGTILRQERASLSFVVSGPVSLQLVIQEVPSGLIDGSNMDFVTQYNFSNVLIYLNGLRLHSIDDYIVTGLNTFSLAYPPQIGDYLLVDYIRS